MHQSVIYNIHGKAYRGKGLPIQFVPSYRPKTGSNQVIFMYCYSSTDEHIDPCIQQNKPQNSLTSTVSTWCSKARNAACMSNTTL